MANRGNDRGLKSQIECERGPPVGSLRRSHEMVVRRGCRDSSSGICATAQNWSTSRPGVGAFPKPQGERQDVPASDFVGCGAGQSQGARVTDDFGPLLPDGSDRRLIPPPTPPRPRRKPKPITRCSTCPTSSPGTPRHSAHRCASPAWAPRSQAGTDSAIWLSRQPHGTSQSCAPSAAPTTIRVCRCGATRGGRSAPGRGCAGSVPFGLADSSGDLGTGIRPAREVRVEHRHLQLPPPR